MWRSQCTCKSEFVPVHCKCDLRGHPYHHALQATILVRSLEFGRKLGRVLEGAQHLHATLLLQLVPLLLQTCHLPQLLLLLLQLVNAEMLLLLLVVVVVLVELALRGPAAAKQGSIL